MYRLFIGLFLRYPMQGFLAPALGHVRPFAIQDMLCLGWLDWARIGLSIEWIAFLSPLSRKSIMGYHSGLGRQSASSGSTNLSSLNQASRENAESRIYLGIPRCFELEAGIHGGLDIAEFAVDYQRNPC
jgi:hypothetical protein